jgi:GNAT superfamily N-acetyltransferase
MSTVSIRTATAADLDLVIGFIRALAEYERLADEVRLDPLLIGCHLFGDRPMAEVLIGEIDRTPRGFALFFHNFSTFEGKPGIGLGKALLARLAQLALERGCARLEWSVLDWNTPAIDFYTSLGAKPMDEWTVNRVEGDALMALAVRS